MFAARAYRQGYFVLSGFDSHSAGEPELELTLLWGEPDHRVNPVMIT